jgi:hypothetical protein
MLDAFFIDLTHYVPPISFSLLDFIIYHLCTSNVKANFRLPWLDESTVCTMLKTLKLNSDVSDFGSKRYKREYSGTNGGVRRRVHMVGSGVWSQAVYFCWRTFLSSRRFIFCIQLSLNKFL